MNQREYFNTMAEVWDNICIHDMKKIEYILGLLNIKAGAKILDVGTGTGILVPFLSELAGKQGEIIAVDVSENMLKMARQKYNYSNVSYLCDDVLEADLPKHYFDFVVCYSVFPHFEDKKYTLQKLSEYLSENGKLIICHSQSRDAINNLHRNASEAVSKDNLPNTKKIKEYLSLAHINTVLEIDNKEMFVVIAQN